MPSIHAKQLHFAQGLLKTWKERVKLQNENRKASETGVPPVSRRDIPTGMSLDHEGRNVYEKANRKRGNGLDPVSDAAACNGVGGGVYGSFQVGFPFF